MAVRPICKACSGSGRQLGAHRTSCTECDGSGFGVERSDGRRPGLSRANLQFVNLEILSGQRNSEEIDQMFQALGGMMKDD